MAGEAVHGLTSGEWISACGLAVVIILQLLKWASDKGEARATRLMLEKQLDELKGQISKLWARSDEHSEAISYMRGRMSDSGRFSRVAVTPGPEDEGQ